MKSKSNIAIPFLENMSTVDARATAKAAGLKVGKSKKDTVAILAAAIDDGKLHFKQQGTLSFKPADGSASRQNFFVAVNRTYTSGPGEENQVLLTPAKPLSPVAGD